MTHKEERLFEICEYHKTGIPTETVTRQKIHEVLFLQDGKVEYVEGELTRTEEHEEEVEKVVQEFRKSWHNPTWGNRHDLAIPAFYDPGAEEGDEQMWDEEKIVDWLRATLSHFIHLQR